MKRNSISAIEQHVEKIFFIVFLFAFVGVITLQFLGGGSTVQVGSQNLPLGRAYEELGDLAATQLGNMDSPTVDSRVPQTVDDLSSQVLASLESPSVGSTDWNPMVLGFVSGDLSFERFVAQEHSVDEFTIPAPVLVGVAQHAGTLDPLIASAYRDELRDIVPSEQPFDIRTVSVGYTIDRDVLYAALADANVPENWYKKMVVLDVEVERRRVGSGEQTLVAPMPGRFSIREQLTSTLDAVEAQSIENMAKGKSQAEQLLHPKMYRFVAGRPWMPPTLDEESSDLNRIYRLIQNIKAAEHAIQEITQQLQQIAMDERMAGIFAQVGSRGGGGGGGRNTERNTEQLEADRKSERRDALLAQISQHEGRIEEYKRQLATLGVEFTGDTLEVALPEYDPGPARLSETSVDKSLVGWANDLDVESGQQYQYRVRYISTNPLFGNEAQLNDASRVLAQTPYVYSEWSDWSESIEVDRNEYWLATNTTGLQGNSLGISEPAGIVDVYRFFYGYWRKTSVRLHAGDAISAGLDLATLELPLFDIDNPNALPQPIDQSLDVNTGAIVMDIRDLPGSDGEESSIIVRDALGLVRSYEVGRRTDTELRRRLEESFLSSVVASTLSPLGDVESSIEETVEEVPEEEILDESEASTGSPDGRRGPGRDGRR